MRPVTQFFAVNLDVADPDLQEVLTGDGGLLSMRDREQISTLFREGEGNHAVASRLSETFAGTTGTMSFSAVMRRTFLLHVGLEVNVLDKLIQSCRSLGMKSRRYSALCTRKNATAFLRSRSSMSLFP
jgi:hypothetical protein